MPPTGWWAVGMRTERHHYSRSRSQFLKSVYLANWARIYQSSWPIAESYRWRHLYSGLCWRCSEWPFIRFITCFARALFNHKWSQTGYACAFPVEFPRNLFGSRTEPLMCPSQDDLTVSFGATKTTGWKNGTYDLLRRVQMHLETWDRTSLKEQRIPLVVTSQQWGLLGQLMNLISGSGTQNELKTTTRTRRLPCPAG